MNENPNRRALNAVNGSSIFKPTRWFQQTIGIIFAGFVMFLGAQWYESNEQLAKIEVEIAEHNRKFKESNEHQRMETLLNFTAKDAGSLLDDLDRLERMVNSLNKRIAELARETVKLEQKLYKLEATVEHLPPVDWQRVILDNERNIKHLHDRQPEGEH